MQLNYVIIGGVAAGMSAAMEIYRTDENARITVLEQGTYYSYGQCGLPYIINKRIPSIDDVIARTVETFRHKYHINALTNKVVTNISTDEQTVLGYDVRTKEVFHVAYDRLLIATGAQPNVPSLEGVELEGIHTLKTIPDTEAIMSHLDNKVEHSVIVGGGYIGLEMTESLTTLGKKVTLIQRGQQLANIFDADMATFIYDEAIEKGVDVILNESVEKFSGHDGIVDKVITDHGSYTTDFVLLAIGVQPNTRFLNHSNLHLTDQGAIKVNAYMETNIDNIYAAGDCATHFHLVKQKDDYIPLGTTANKQGTIAGANMAGNPVAFKGITGTSIIKFFDLTLGRTGLSEKEAKLMKISYDIAKYEGTDITNYYPGNKKMSIKLLYCKKTYRLLGGQIIGEKGVSKRIDVLTTAIFNDMTVHELIDLDLSYAPQFNNVRDPLQQTARQV